MSSAAHRDSDLFVLSLLPGGLESTPLASSSSNALPVMDLNSTDPLPPFTDRLGSNLAVPSQESNLDSAATAQERFGMWLEGNVMMCSCPECRAPMSVRLWLMVADCWRCGTSIELSEEQEKEVQRLLDQREKSRRTADSPRKAAPPSPPAPKATTSASPAPAVPAPAIAKTEKPVSTVPSPLPPPPPPPSRELKERKPDQAVPVPVAPTPRFKTLPVAANPSESSPVASASAAMTSTTPPEIASPMPATARRSAPTEPLADPSATAPATTPLPSPPVVPAPPQIQITQPVQRPKRSVLARRRRDNWLQRLLKDVPAWVISMILHMVMIALLALYTFQEKREGIYILLSSTVSRERDGGETKFVMDKSDDLKFDLPIPDNINLKNKKIKDALVEANKSARELRLDPDAPAPNLADLARVKELVSSDDPIRRSLAVRDPRLRVEIAKKEGGTTLTEAAVARGLRWLASQQKPSGSWSNGDFEMAHTALALLPFLGAGQTQNTGRYQETVAKGLRWMIQHQGEDGDLRGSKKQHPGMYAHGISSIVLCDAFGMTGDENLRKPAQKAVDFIVDAQNPAGGWRYFPRQDADLSVVGWQLMALQSARMSGLKVPREVLELADHYLDTVSSKGGSQYGYVKGSAGTPTMTAEGLLCRMYLGWNQDNPGLTQGVDYLAKNLPSKSSWNIYYWYYGTQVLHHMGGEPWEQWNQRMRDLLVESQVSEGRDAGSWSPDRDPYGSKGGGRIFQTSLSTCTLEVYYRHAPIYRKLKID